MSDLVWPTDFDDIKTLGTAKSLQPGEVALIFSRAGASVPVVVVRDELTQEYLDNVAASARYALNRFHEEKVAVPV